MNYANGRPIHDADSHLMELDDCLRSDTLGALLGARRKNSEALM